MSRVVAVLMWILVWCLPAYSLEASGHERGSLIVITVLGAWTIVFSAGMAYAEQVDPARSAQRAAERAAREWLKVLAGSWFRVAPVICLGAELAMFVRIGKLRLPWEPVPFDSLQSAVTKLVAAAVPAVGRIPDVFAREALGAHPDRADLLQDVFAWGYVASALVVLGTARAAVRAVLAPGVSLQALQGPTQAERTRWVLVLSTMFLAGFLFVSTGIERDRAHRELFSNFEFNDVQLVYRATFGPLFVTGCIAMLLVAAIRSYRDLSRPEERSP